MEGSPVEQILLDTGCSRTLVQQKLVPACKLIEGESIAICCAHENTVLYPLANVQVTVGDKTLDVEAAVSDTLPVDVLLGTDVKELPELLHQRSKEERIHPDLDLMAVVTRAQSRKEAEEEVAHQQREQDCGVSPSSTEEELWMTTFDDALFEAGNRKTKKSRSQKRRDRHAHTRRIVSCVEPEEPPGMTGINYSHPLQFSAGEMKSLQEADNSLDTIKVAAKGHPCTAGIGFFQKQDLLYRLWTPPGREGPSMAVEQLVLPVKCRKEVLQLAHSIPLSGHLGKESDAFSNASTGLHSTGMLLNTAGPVNNVRRRPYRRADVHQ